MKVEDRCFVSRSRQTVIDVLKENGRTVCFDKTLEDTRKEYPDAEEMTLDTFCQWKAEKQRTTITWQETTKEQYYNMLEALPPACWIGTGFLLGEPADHDAGSGQPRYDAFFENSGLYLTASRPMTILEFNSEMADMVKEGTK